MFGKTPSRWIVALALAAGLPVLLHASQRQIVRLGTLAPDPSPWTNALRDMSIAWQKATGDRVTMRLQTAGFASDSTIITRMAAQGLDAGTLFIAGLSEIDKSFNAFGIPFFFESDAELEHVQRAMQPFLAQKLQARTGVKYRLLNWANGGWVRLFSKKALRSIPEIQASKLYTTAGDAETIAWYGRAGFNAVPLPPSEIPLQLKNPFGRIDATPSPPVYAAASGFYTSANYMLDVRLGPFIAATVITERAWSQMSATDQDAILKASQAMERQVSSGAPALDAKYIDEMRKNGLNVATLTPKELDQFKAKAAELALTQRGSIVPADAFDLATQARAEYRKGRK